MPAASACADTAAPSPTPASAAGHAGNAPENPGSSAGNGGMPAFGGSPASNAGAGNAPGGPSGAAGVGGGAGGSASSGQGSGGAGGITGSSGTGGADHAAGTPGGGARGGRASAGAAAGGASAGTSAPGAGGAPEPCGMNQRAACTGTDPIECHFGGNPGDYLVTVELGGDAAGDTYVEAESFRRMLGDTVTTAGATQRLSFFVNVRQPEGQPIQDVPAGTPGLDLYFHGSAPELSAVCFETGKSAPKLWIAGDSTVCDQDTIDYAGWGQHLPQFIVPPVSVANFA
ncbi:MAG TPA: hypothetical protein VGQ57_16075, partial [Polyangiaceae bacterium]|nr:hypothetical protein [Polyangiaceae bacterium]